MPFHPQMKTVTFQKTFILGMFPCPPFLDASYVDDLIRVFMGELVVEKEFMTKNAPLRVETVETFAFCENEN